MLIPLCSKRQRIFVPLSHFDVRVIHSRSDGTHKIANIHGSRDTLPIPLYIISALGLHTPIVTCLLVIPIVCLLHRSVHRVHAAEFRNHPSQKNVPRALIKTACAYCYVMPLFKLECQNGSSHSIELKNCNWQCHNDSSHSGTQILPCQNGSKCQLSSRMVRALPGTIF